MKLEGSSAVITGGAGGIGFEVARVLLQDYGCSNVAICDNSTVRLEEAKDKLRTLHLESLASFHCVDVADRDQVKKMCDEVIERWGRVSLLFNNAGIVAANNLEDSPWEELELVLNVNIWGVINCTKVFLKHLKKEKAAFIVNTSSLEGILAIPGNISYCTSKYAVRGFSEGLMIDNSLICPNVQVCSVHPGFVSTNILAHNAARLRTDHLSPDFVKKSLPEVKVSSIEAGFKAMGSTTPAEAANQIVSGIRRGQTRILVGNDCLILDWLVRLFPRLIYYRPIYFPVLTVVLTAVRMIGKKTIIAILLFLAIRKRMRN